MAQNLNYSAPSGSKCYGNNNSNCDTYGRLYNWATAMVACPIGWHLPEDDEWRELIDFAGVSPATKLRAKNSWNSCTEGYGTDDFGFAALPGGHCNTGACNYSGPGGMANIWTATSHDNTDAYFIVIGCNVSDPKSYDKNYAGRGKTALFYSVRCVQD